jgi:hypothetical protein
MSCCGKRLPSSPRVTEVPRSAAPRPVGPASGMVLFCYMGMTAATVTGPVTGRQYRFPSYGAIAAVDVRDAAGVAAVPVLRRV